MFRHRLLDHNGMFLYSAIIVKLAVRSGNIKKKNIESYIRDILRPAGCRISPLEFEMSPLLNMNS